MSQFKNKQRTYPAHFWDQKKITTANTSANIPCQISKPMVKPNRSRTKFQNPILSLGNGLIDLPPQAISIALFGFA